jgi:hypothetical protein
MATYLTTGLHVWTLEYEHGDPRIVAGSSLATLINGESDVISAVRGAAFIDEPAVVTALVPATAALGAPDFTLHVQGTGFQQGSVILWNGTPEATTFVSATELTTGVNMATAIVPGDIPVGVRSLVGRDSNTLPFTLTATA